MVWAAYREGEVECKAWLAASVCEGSLECRSAPAMATRGDECEPRELLKVLLYVEAGEESWDANDSTSSMERDSHPF